MKKASYSFYEFHGEVVKGYDLFNHLASAGLDFFWRRATARTVKKFTDGLPAAPLLDLACGTCDMAMALAQQMPGRSIVGVDPSADMLQAARRKIQKPQFTGISLVRGVSRLPFADGRFAAVTCAFGLRNFIHLQQELKEIHRLLEPGGAIFALDFYRPQNRFGRLFLTAFNALLFPLLGFIATGKTKPYRYLFASIFKFAAPAEFESLLQSCGFDRTRRRAFFAGLVHVIIAEKRKDE
jgi:demethylmenaquinone methyltransferase / 2-methoxy-6-polyprenyl-1,4-benzoquinol methylase